MTNRVIRPPIEYGNYPRRTPERLAYDEVILRTYSDDPERRPSDAELLEAHDVMRGDAIHGDHSDTGLILLPLLREVLALRKRVAELEAAK